MDTSSSQHNALRAAGRARTGPPTGGGAGTTVARTVAVRATVPPWCPPGGRLAAGTAPSSRRGRVPARVDAWLGAGRQAGPPARAGQT
jgi:hypothetical protein